MHTGFSPWKCATSMAHSIPASGAGSETVRVFGVDAGYGGDLCVGICAEFGTDVTGITAIKFHEPVVIPVRMTAPKTIDCGGPDCHIRQR